MIRGITAGRYLTVQNGNPGSTYVNNFSGAQGVGNMRYNTANQYIEVYDGTQWQQLATGHATIDLNGEAQQLLEWAQKERFRQMERESRARAHPSLRRALDAIERAEKNFDLLEKFVEHDQERESSGVQASP